MVASTPWIMGAPIWALLGHPKTHPGPPPNHPISYAKGDAKLTTVPRVTRATWQELGAGGQTEGQEGTPRSAESLTINPGPLPVPGPRSPAALAPAPAMAAVGSSGGTGLPPSPVNPGSRHTPPSPLQLLLERATAIEEELAQVRDLRVPTATEGSPWPPRDPHGHPEPHGSPQLPRDPHGHQGIPTATQSPTGPHGH